MADPVSEIEAQLRRPVTLADANDQRKKLNQSFDLLNADQARKLLERLLTWDGARLPVDFRRLHRAVRLELLLKLAMRLGTQASAQFHARLTGGNAQTPADAKLQQGLRLAFPDGMPGLRDKFLQALRGQRTAGTPSVALEFRGDSKLKFSADNQCPSRTVKGTGQSAVPDHLGPDPDPGSGKNWMEIRGTVTGHRPDAEYRFRRTIEVGAWYLVGSDAWKCAYYGPPGTDDDAHDTDEDTHPDNDHIYVIEGPGPTSIPPGLSTVPAADRPKVTQYVYMMNALEMVDVRFGPGAWLQVGRMEWYSVTWLETAGGTWRRKPGGSKIEKGAISDMETAATTGQPPTTF